jgi:hypothetical protein
MTAFSRVILQLLGCVVVAVVCTGMVHNARPFLDAEVYRAAIEAFRSGESPYDDKVIAAHSGITTLYFVYPPHILVVASFFASWLRNPYGLAALAIGYGMTIIAIPYFQERWMLGRYRRAWPLLGALLFLAWFGQNRINIGPLGFAGVVSIFCGTVTLPLYGAALAALALFFQRRRWSAFYSIVWLAACIKPQFLMLLAFPFLLTEGQFINCICVIAAAAAIYVADFLWLPTLWKQFLFAVHQQTIVKNDVWRGAFGLVSHLFVPNIGETIPDPIVRLAGLVQVGWLCVVGCVAWAVRHRIRQSSGQQSLIVAWITLTVLVANPRLAVYDLCLGSIPFIALSTELCRGHRRMAAAYGTALVLNFVICGFHFEPNFPILAIGLAWVFGAVLLMQTPLSPEEAGPTK